MTTLASCTTSVCRDATALIGQISDASAEIDTLQTAVEYLGDKVEESGGSLQCVVNGPVGQVCQLPLGGALPTLAEALSQLNATALGSMPVDQFVATQGQAAYTLSTGVTNLNYVEVAHNGALLLGPTDYVVAGTLLTLTFPAEAGDSITARHFILS